MTERELIKCAQRDVRKPQHACRGWPRRLVGAASGLPDATIRSRIGLRKPASGECRFTHLVATVGAIALASGGCVGPPVLEQQVLGYDQVAKTLNEKLLLLNIARVANGEAVHFTSTSSIAATFDWTTSVGVSSQIEGSSGVDFFNFNLGASASENPTFSIIPVSGEEFTKRIVTPFRDEVFQFLVFQGERIGQIMRLMAAGIEVQGPDGRFVRFIENNPERRGEYEEFRRIADHLQRLNDQRHLFVRALVFQETLIDDFKGEPRSQDINDGFNMGLRWRQKPDGDYALTRLSAGRVVVLNFDPMALSDKQRFELNERIKRNPSGFAYLELRPDRPGGGFAIQGAIKLRSMFQILNFLAGNTGDAKEFEIIPDTRIGALETSPAETMRINVTKEPPVSNVPSVFYDGRYYSIGDSQWDQRSFTILNVLFQTTVGDVEDVSIPITIAK